MFANIYRRLVIPRPRVPAILSVLTGFLTSFMTQLTVDHPQYVFRILYIAVAYYGVTLGQLQPE